MRITNTGETVTDADLDDATLDLVAEQASTTLASTTVQSGVVNGDDDADDEADDDTPESGDNITADQIEKAKREYLKRVVKDGQKDGLGKKAKLNFSQTLVEGAMDHNAIVPADAERFYKAFEEASAKKAMFEDGTKPYDAEASANKNPKSFASQVDKFAALIRLGNAFVDEDKKATDIVTRARGLHIRLLEGSEKKALKYKSTIEAIVAVARAQFKDEYAGLPLTDQQMTDLWMGTVKVKTGIDLLYAALDNIKQARKGKEANPEKDEPGRKAIEHDVLPVAEANLHKVLSDLDPDGYDKYMKKNEKAKEKEQLAAFRHSYRNAA